MKHRLSLGSIKTTVGALLLLYVILVSATGCSKDETANTGKVAIEFAHWDPARTDHLFIIVSPLDQPDKTLKQQKMISRSVNTIELNPGNYMIRIVADYNDSPRITEYVQVQIGKTELIQL